MDEKQKLRTKFSVWYFVAAIALLVVFQNMIYGPMVTRRQEVTYDEFRKHLSDNQITEVTIKTDRIFYKKKDEANKESVHNVVRLDDPELTKELLAAGVDFKATPPSGGGWSSLFGWIVPLLPLLLIWYFVFQRMGKGPGNILSMGKSKAREIEGGLQNITFADVGGIDEVEIELKELIGFLKQPEQFNKMGASLPKGVFKFLMSERELKERLAVLFGGRAAELIVYSEASSGAANDMEKATQIARRMVTEFGMNNSLGPVRYAQNVGMGNFLGGQPGMQDVSPQTAALIDKDIGDLIETAQNQAIELLVENRAALDKIAEQLQEHEVISGEEVHRIASEMGTQIPR